LRTERDLNIEKCPGDTPADRRSVFLPLDEPRREHVSDSEDPQTFQDYSKGGLLADHATVPSDPSEGITSVRGDSEDAPRLEDQRVCEDREHKAHLATFRCHLIQSPQADRVWVRCDLTKE
jgi:hypothetical protein